VQGYTGAVRWFAACHLIRQAGKTSWEQADRQDIQQWMTQLLDRYSGAYASIQFRALRQFFKWLAAEEELPTRWPGSAHPGWQCGMSRCSPA
jgi:site-specific recombinase XerD